MDPYHVPTAAIEGVPPGATRAGVIGRLGEPIGQPVRRVVRGPDLCCIVYAAKRFDANRGGNLRAFCFRGGRLAVQRDW